MDLELIKKNIREYISELRTKKRYKSAALKKFCQVWAVLYVVSLVVLLCMLGYADILPAGYLYSLLVILALLSLLVFPILYFDYIKDNRKIAALVLSVVLMGIFTYAEVNLKDTADFFSRVTHVNEQTKDYYVVVDKDRNLQSISDIDKKTVGVYSAATEEYSTAQESLNSRVEVQYDQCENLEDMDEGLTTGKDDALFLSQMHYETMCENEDAFEDKTKILYTVKMDIGNEDFTRRVGVTSQPFNVYISGLDTSGKISEVSRSDVNMIVTVNPQTHTVLLTSIPRDMQIQMPSYYDANDKLTHTGIYGVHETVKAAEKLMGQDINYYLKVNYSTVSRFIDAIGGVDVYSDYAFETHGQKYFKFKKGKNHLNGKRALAFARERKAFENGDVQRNIDQAKVMEAILTKVTGSATILTKYNKILKSVKDYMEMNMSGEEIRALVKMQLEGGYSWKIKKQNLVGTGAYDTCYSSGSYQLYVMIPNQDNVKKAAENIENIMNGKEFVPLDKKSDSDEENS